MRYIGTLPVYFDMKTLMNFYGPRSILANIACAEDHEELMGRGGVY